MTPASSAEVPGATRMSLRKQLIVPEDNVLKVNVPQDNSAINPEHCSVALSSIPTGFG